jgi:hypothetical protein
MRWRVLMDRRRIDIVNVSILVSAFEDGEWPHSLRTISDLMILALMRKALAEMKAAISQSHEVIASTRDAIAFLDRLHALQISN